MSARGEINKIFKYYPLCSLDFCASLRAEPDLLPVYIINSSFKEKSDADGGVEAEIGFGC